MMNLTSPGPAQLTNVSAYRPLGRYLRSKHGKTTKVADNPSKNIYIFVRINCSFENEKLNKQRKKTDTKTRVKCTMHCGSAK